MEKYLNSKAYEKFVKDGEQAIANEVEYFVNMGFDINKKETVDSIIKLYRALPIDPAENLARVERITLMPNDEYNFDYFIESRDFPSDEMRKVLPYLVNYSVFEAGLDSSKITDDERKQAADRISFLSSIESEPENR